MLLFISKSSHYKYRNKHKLQSYVSNLHTKILMCSLQNCIESLFLFVAKVFYSVTQIKNDSWQKLEIQFLQL